MKKKVAFLSAKMSLGGAERVISNLVNSLSNDVEVHTLLLYEQTENDYPLNGRVVSFGDRKKRNRIFEILYFSSKIKKYIELNNIDCVISFMEYPNLLNILIPKKVKKIISVRNFMTEKWKNKEGRFWKWSFKRLYPKAHVIVCPTKLIIEDMELNFKAPKKKLKLIYNPYAMETLILQKEELIEFKYASWFDDFTVITMGNLSKAKGHCHLIRAFAKVKETYPKAKLVILGEGPYREKLVELTKSLNLFEDVLFLGFQSNPHKFLGKSNLYVLSSYYEGFPNALAEAMVCGLPIISTDCKSGPREILSPKTPFNKTIDQIEDAEFGVLTPVFKNECFDSKKRLSLEEEALATAIISIMEDSNKYNKYKEKSQERVKDFSIKNISNKWLELIND